MPLRLDTPQPAPRTPNTSAHRARATRNVTPEAGTTSCEVDPAGGAEAATAERRAHPSRADQGLARIAPTLSTVRHARLLCVQVREGRAGVVRPAFVAVSVHAAACRSSTMRADAGNSDGAGVALSAAVQASFRNA